MHTIMMRYAHHDGYNKFINNNNTEREEKGQRVTVIKNKQ